MMSRTTLLALQILVAVVCIALWHVLTTVPINGVKLLPPFFFSTPLDVGNRIVKWLVDRTICRHLAITLTESILAFVIRSLARATLVFLFLVPQLAAAIPDPFVQ